ncbi:MAG: hypothetical protein ABJE63_12505 [Lentilitoribacter sp.]
MTGVRAIGSFNQKLMTLMEDIEYRRVESIEDLEEVAALRRRAYEPVGLAPDKHSIMIDKEDFAANAHVIGVYYLEQLVATMRIHHVTSQQQDGLAMKQFPEVVGPMLDAGMSVVDPLKFAADPILIKEVPGLAYLTVRTALMASEYYKADHCLAIIRSNHRAFYRRFLNFNPLAEPKYNAYLDCDLDIYGGHIKQTLPSIKKRYPFFNSTAFEQKRMFAPLSEINLPPLSIIPQVQSFYG